MTQDIDATNTELLLSLFAEVARGAPLVISAYDREGKFILQIGKGLEKLGLQPNELVGASVFDAFAGADEALRLIRAALVGESGTNTQSLGTTIWDNWFSPIRDGTGELIGGVSISTDVTERERIQAELERRLAELEVQSRAIRQLAAPILEVWAGVLVVPVVGQLDAEGADALMERLLVKLAESRARFAILDLTGVATIDSQTADRLLRILGAVTLLGVRGLVSGIGPKVAQALVSAGVDLSQVTTFASLHAALRECMG